MRLVLVKTVFIASLAWMLQGCETLEAFMSKDSSASKEEEYAGWDDKMFHEKAKEALDNKNYQKAVTLYEALESRYPFGDYAAQAQLNVAFAYYKNDDPEAALAAADRFIKIHPRNPSVDYAYYLKGLINYNRGIGFIDRFLPTDSSQRDPGPAKDSYDNFQELIRRYPNSQYVADAKLRMIALRNNMAMYEVHVADFYMRRKAYVAAVNRANYIIKEYQRTPAVPFALQIMQDGYRQLGMDELAADAERIYTLNYPAGAPQANYKDEGAIQKVWDAMGLDK
ncbi:Outer membrane beta-barrel assembly protein BamD [Methylomonas albis]|uniref:Outer membrane protein assembly factor BamD n=1 Tax=Methylomonas albis TaxID=1854563 RepID=A0ABR9CUH1_9GAMM|nr:outer membrane protein assembly factor BamD [Methylomonas albis]MBD9354453.1 outer membrane protein assembly factor BamD [Methylomonas albis]CAD6877331.1 Outer membrane beta-barrel assembly protein BamD [Methylomonas albis]